MRAGGLSAREHLGAGRGAGYTQPPPHTHRTQVADYPASWGRPMLPIPAKSTMPPYANIQPMRRDATAPRKPGVGVRGAGAASGAATHRGMY